MNLVKLVVDLVISGIGNPELWANHTEDSFDTFTGWRLVKVLGILSFLEALVKIYVGGKVLLRNEPTAFTTLLALDGKHVLQLWVQTFGLLECVGDAFLELLGMFDVKSELEHVREAAVVGIDLFLLGGKPSLVDQWSNARVGGIGIDGGWLFICKLLCGTGELVGEVCIVSRVLLLW